MERNLTSGSVAKSMLVFALPYLLYTYTIKPPALRVVPHPALALDNKTSNAIISVGPKPHYI